MKTLFFQLTIAIATLYTLFILPLSAEENVNPGINKHYQAPVVQKWKNVFERPGREVYDRRKEVVSALELTPGLDIADIGAGTGFYSLLFAQQVGPTGRVFAVDTSQNFVEATRSRADSAGLKNITAMVNSQTSTGLGQQSVDVIFVCDTYHHFEYPKTMLNSMYESLRPGGRLFIIDFVKQSGKSSDWVMNHVRANQQQVVAEIEAAGFKLDHRIDLLDSNYFLRFRKPETTH